MKVPDKTNIFDICDKLNAAGEKPTLERVRKALGGGSFSTIQPLLREWKDKRTSEPAQAALAVPEEFRAMVDNLAAQIWAKAAAKGEETLNAVKGAMQAKLDEAEQERSDATQEIQSLEEQVQQQGTEVKDLKIALQDARIMLEVQSRQIVEFEAMTKRHEKTLVEMGEIKARLLAAEARKA